MKKKLNCVLLIDDDEPTNFFNQLVLEKTGYVEHVVTQPGGHQALQYLSNVKEGSNEFPRPDLIFLDINMPAMNGWEFLEEYKKLDEEQKGRMMIVMLTTSLFPEDKAKALNIPGVSGFEHKPLTKGKLEKIIEQFFEAEKIAC